MEALAVLNHFLSFPADFTDIAEWILLDKNGFLIAPGESAADYRERLMALRDGLTAFNDALADRNEVELEPGFSVCTAERLPPGLDAECERLTDSLYGFQTDWVPAFFPVRNLGFLWAGCTYISDEYPFPVFMIRREFKKSPHYLKIYSRTELLAHEKCHAARAPFNDDVFEEHFAYALSRSAFRRCFGNCFRTGTDAVLFAAPLFLLSMVQIVTAFFGWIAPTGFWPAMMAVALFYPLFLLIRNFRDRRCVLKASVFLQKAGCLKPEAVLFRCSAAEIRGLSGNNGSSTLRQLLTQPIRGMLLQTRFFPHNFQEV